VAFPSHACRLSSRFVSIEPPVEVEVVADIVEEVGADPVSSLVAAGQGSLPSMSASQSFSAKISVAASSQF
jgi:hypothetical protein